MRQFVLALALATAAAAAAAEPIELTGVMTDAAGVRVALRESATGLSRWVQVGQGFAGYTLQAFDVPSEVAFVTKDGKEIRLRLVDAKIKDGAAPRLTVETARAIYQNLRQIYAAADQFYLEHARLSATLDELVGPGKYIRRLVSVAEEDYATLTLKQGAPIVLTTPSGEAIAADSMWAANATFAFRSIMPGDTGRTIAAGAQITVPQLMALNEGVDWTKLKVGEVVRVK